MRSGAMTVVQSMRAHAIGLLAAAVALAGGAAAVSAGELDYTLTGDFKVHVVSMREARFQTIILQKFDYSCGSAALASLLTYHYDRPTTEDAVFKAMFDTGDQEKIKQEGFSLLDMKVHLARQGLVADGYKMTLDRLEKLGVPVITLINTGGYRHFVIIKGIRGDDVVIGDPAQGVIIVPRAKFEPVWSGVVLVIKNEASRGKDHFNLAQDWQVRQKAPFGTALTRDSLANFNILTTMQTPF
jgi:predicted double-glycine peptidase